MTTEYDEIDLSQYDEQFAAAPDIDDSKVPDGKYTATIDRVEFKKAKSSGRDMFHWELSILGPEHAGRKLFRNNMLDKPEWLKKDLRTCGVHINRLSELKLSDLLDLVVEVTVSTRGENSNVYLNRLVSPGNNATAAGQRDDVIPF